MLSRVANSIFWMGRYMERSTCLLRVARTHYIASQDDMQDMDWQALLRMYSAQDKPLPATLTTPPAILRHLILERDNAASVINNIARARENARAVQDNITKEVWQCLNDYYHLIRETNLQHQLGAGDPVSVLDMLLRECMLYYGTVDTTMARGEIFNFMNIGKFLERALQSLYVLQMRLDASDELTETTETTGWRYVLYSLSGYQLYLKMYRGKIQPKLIVQHVLHNSHFPHSALYCIQQMHRYFERLQAESREENFQQVDFQMGKTFNLVRYSNVLEMTRQELRVLLYVIQKELIATTNCLNQYYFGLNY